MKMKNEIQKNLEQLQWSQNLWWLLVYKKTPSEKILIIFIVHPDFHHFASSAFFFYLYVYFFVIFLLFFISLYMHGCPVVIVRTFVARKVVVKDYASADLVQCKTMKPWNWEYDGVQEEHKTIIIINNEFGFLFLYHVCNTACHLWVMKWDNYKP